MAFAVTAMHESDRASTSDEPQDLSEETLFWGSKQIDGDHLQGTRFSSADRALRRWGQPAEELWPYDSTRDHSQPEYQPPPEAIDPMNCYFAALQGVPLDVDRVRDELEAGRPVAIGIRIWDGFRRAQTQPLPAPDISELLPTGHAVVIVGHDRQAEAFLIRNSWGDAWGDGGYLWVRDEILGMALAAWAIDGAPAVTRTADESYQGE